MFLVLATAVTLAAAAPVEAQPGPAPDAARRGADRPAVPERAAPGRPVGEPVPARPAQLSPDERRQLRRDISDHGREIYPPRPAPKGDRPASRPPGQ
jgi:hypothetical protein